MYNEIIWKRNPEGYEQPIYISYSLLMFLVLLYWRRQ